MNKKSYLNEQKGFSQGICGIHPNHHNSPQMSIQHVFHFAK